MEILKENLLVILTLINAIVFMFVWSGTTKGPIRRVFSHMRMKNLIREWTLAGTELIVISFLCTCLYYFLSNSLKLEYQAGFPMLFMVLFAGAFYLLASNEAIKKRVLLVLLVVSLLLVICPGIVIVCAFAWELSLDLYYLYIGIAFALLDLIGMITAVRYWRKGDL